MKLTQITILTAALGLIISASSARADLGDTYARSCLKYGGPGYADKADHAVLWKQEHCIIAESFYKNECVRITFIPEPGTFYTAADVERISRYECGTRQTWMSFDGGDAYVGSWCTTDGALIATLYYNGTVQFIYQWFLKAKGLSQAPVHINPPVEDNPVTIEHKDHEQMQQWLSQDTDPRHLV
jgi:hypothetical protein